MLAVVASQKTYTLMLCPIPGCMDGEWNTPKVSPVPTMKHHVKDRHPGWFEHIAWPPAHRPNDEDLSLDRSDLEQMNLRQLRELAGRHGVVHYHVRKSQLLEALARALRAEARAR